MDEVGLFSMIVILIVLGIAAAVFVHYYSKNEQQQTPIKAREYTNHFYPNENIERIDCNEIDDNTYCSIKTNNQILTLLCNSEGCVNSMVTRPNRTDTYVVPVVMPSGR